MNRPEPIGRAAAEPPPFGEFARAFLKVGLLSFGGPAGQIAMMHKLVVDERRWLDEKRYLDALNFCMLLPGPEAQQLATFVGWHVHRVKGALTAGILFVLPGALMMLALAAAYMAFGKLPLVEAAFYGVKAGVLAIVVEALLRIGRRALKTRVAWAIAAAAFVGLFAFDLPYPAVVVAAGLVGWLTGRKGTSPAEPAPAPPAGGAGTRPLAMLAAGCTAWALPVAVAAVMLGPTHVLVDVAAFFSKLAVVTFGGAYAVLAYMADAAVKDYGWLGAGEMLDGLGLAETTPGPLILVTQFVGYIAGYRNPAPLDPATMGVLAAAMTTWVTFTPSITWILVGAPLVDRIGRNPALSAALSGITAAVVGVILKLSLWFAFHVLFARVERVEAGPFVLDLPVPATIDLAAVALALAAAWVLFRRHWPVVGVVGLTALMGIVVRWP